MKRSLIVRYVNGTAEIVQTERDDALGRKALERAAFEHIARTDVASVEVTTADRYARTGRKVYR